MSVIVALNQRSPAKRKGKGKAKCKSVDYSRIYNAFALTARKDNVTLHPGCRFALPWAMCFCAYSACWSMCSLRASSQSKSGTVPFWVHQTGQPIKHNKNFGQQSSPKFCSQNPAYFGCLPNISGATTKASELRIQPKLVPKPAE